MVFNILFGIVKAKDHEKDLPFISYEFLYFKRKFLNIMKNLNKLQIKALKNENNSGMGWSFVIRVRKLVFPIKNLK